MRSAEGRWFEMIAYELFLDIADRTDAIKAVVLKGADVRGKKPFPALGQNGFFYSRNGDITIRGNGQDLAEFDLLMTKPDGSLIFVEVVTSPSDLKDFLQEIYYKNRSSGTVQPESVTFILSPLSRTPIIKAEGRFLDQSTFTLHRSCVISENTSQARGTGIHKNHIFSGRHACPQI